MNIYLISGLCLIIIFAVLVFFKLLIKEFKFWHGLLACLLGIVVVVPIAFAMNFINGYEFLKYTDLFSTLINGILFNGLIEESLKMLILFLLPGKKMKLPEFFACALLCGLSVGCFEMIVYYVNESDTSGLILRLVTAVLIHMSCCGLSGLFVYSVKHKSVKVTPFIYAIILHGVYNYFASFKPSIPFFYISIVVILFAFIECRVRYVKVKSIDGESENDLVKNNGSVKKSKSSSKAVSKSAAKGGASKSADSKSSAKSAGSKSASKKSASTKERTMLKIKNNNDKTIVSIKKGEKNEKNK